MNFNKFRSVSQAYRKTPAVNGRVGSILYLADYMPAGMKVMKGKIAVIVVIPSTKA